MKVQYKRCVGAELFTTVHNLGPYEAFTRIHRAMFGQVLVMRLFRDHGILAQICGNNFKVLKRVPPLIVSTSQIDEAVEAIYQVVNLAHSPTVFWNEALGLARRVVNV